VLIVALVVVGRLAWPWVGAPVEAVRDRIAGAQVVNPVQITASSAAPAHPPALARDGATNSFWSPARSGAGATEFVEARFADSFRLVAIQVFNGSSERRCC